MLLQPNNKCSLLCIIPLLCGRSSMAAIRQFCAAINCSCWRDTCCLKLAICCCCCAIRVRCSPSCCARLRRAVSWQAGSVAQRSSSCSHTSGDEPSCNTAHPAKDHHNRPTAPGSMSVMSSKLAHVAQQSAATLCTRPLLLLVLSQSTKLCI